MARKRVVSRTILGTKAEVMTVNTVSQKIENVSYLISGTFEDDEKLLKALKKGNETDTIKLVQVVTKEPHNELLAMLEEDFIKMAKPMNPETHKFIEADGTESGEELEDVSTEEQAPAVQEEEIPVVSKKRK